ncbi:anti-CBASS protein Acb1 family protein [Leptospira santarosai]|uniref:anti-CBASS protein Acb1 family protein n=1 Tax=Leptospira santarosai TaxID=28183 RepID=UPI00034D8F9B|nr:anti-CBASS Acb1 family protein [Leptospira santarosai]
MARKRRSYYKNLGIETSVHVAKLDASEAEARLDTLMHIASGKGIVGRDKLRGISANPIRIMPGNSRALYESNGFMANIVDSVAEDATREWIEIETNRDVDNPDTGEKGLNISRMLLNEMEEFDLRGKIEEHIRNSRMDHGGSILFWGIKSDIPQTDAVLSQPLPETIRNLDFINVIDAGRFSIRRKSSDPLSRYYNQPIVSVGGSTLDSSRVHWLVNSWNWDSQRGISVIEKVYEGVIAIDTALWSTTCLIFEMAVKVLSTEKLDSTSPEKTMEFLRLLRHTLSTQSTAILGQGETLTRLGNSGISDSQLETLFSFIFKILSGLSKIPTSRILGQTQSVINIGGGGDSSDVISYHEDVARFQELKVRSIIEQFIKLRIRSTEGEIYRLLNGDYESLDWKIKFKSLFKSTPASEADTNLKNAQSDQIYVTLGVLNPNEIKQMRFQGMQNFDYSEDNNDTLDFTEPEIPKSEESNSLPSQ